jgi:hypothetical protein
LRRQLDLRLAPFPSDLPGHLDEAQAQGLLEARDEIHDLLRLKKEVKSFVNQFHPNFGFGATEIYFK